MSAPDSICQLVEKFDRDKPDSETEVRIQFVDPLFSALGWDLRDKRQVRHEPRVIVREAGVERSKNPDYSFHIGNTRHFFVETKMPQKNLKRDPTPAFQLRRYGYSGKTPASVLTDFEEFCVYDCRVRPYQNDPASKARPLYIRYTDYIDKWEALESRFSREAVAQGALREWIEGERIRGGAGVDKDFLDDMEGWRELLAKDIALHNRGLSQRQLNLLVQRTIDRIVFLRIAEDRDIEAYERLRRAAKADSQVYEELKRLFIEADDKYNSGLFHFSDEKRASEPDRESLKIHIPDEPLRLVIEKLYYPESPYEFSVMPAEILGQVYEQFLGKVIELSPGGAVRIEEKPEVRKAGGVYYTPSYIVDYIVEHTVGALLKEKTPDQAEKLRILDPACGSGSFLVGAYQYLLDWHLRYYAEHSRQYRNRRRETVDGMILTTAEKRRILQNNIYGVDLDQNAVEVSKLSLLLKMLENESDAAGRQTLMFAAGGRILPDLSDNIKWGNSLIGSDFFRGPQARLFADEEEMLKVKAFDWDSEAGFGEIMAAGGFDAVIGNPPYGADLDDLQQDYLRALHNVAEYQLDTYPLFIEKAYQLAKTNSFCGYIIPSAWVASNFDKELRRFLVQNVSIHNVVIAPKNVFKDATVETLIFIFGNNATKQMSFEVERWDVDPSEKYRVSFDRIRLDKDYTFSVYSRPRVTNLIHKLNSASTPIFKHGQAVWGVKVYQRGKGKPPQIGYESKGKIYHSSEKVKDSHLPLLGGREIVRYSLNWRGGYVDYGKWLAEPRTPDWFEGKRILIREVTSKGQIHATIVDDKFVFSNSVDGLRITSDVYKTKFVLGILNSKLITFYHFNSSPNAFKGAFPKVLVKDILNFPLPRNPNTALHDKMVELVDEMLKLHKRLPDLSGEGRRITEALIDTVDSEIDALVYRLYGLSDDEVAIVAGG